MGDIASVREWIRDGVNGIVVSARDTAMVTAAVMRALEDETLASVAREENDGLIRDRADYRRNMRDVESGYELLIRSWPTHR